MTESSTDEKDQSLGDSLSSEEWTIIYKVKDESDEGNTKNEKSADSKETVDNENASQSEENVNEDHVDEAEEADEHENEIDSDDVSIISEESELEHVAFEGRIERIEWQKQEEESTQSKALAPRVPLERNTTSTNSQSLITYSVVILILSVLIAGQIVEYGKNTPKYPVSTELEDKLKEFAGLEKKLKELNDVKQALDNILINVPEMKKLTDQITYQKYENNKPKYSIEDYKNFEKLNIQNILNLNPYDDKLEILEVTYQNFCSTISKINSSNPITENELCKTPKILSDMIIFKKNLKHAFEQTQKTISSEKRIFIDVERKLNSVSESLLSELSTIFSRFSAKIEERFNKFGYKLHKRMCSLNNNGKNNEKFFNILLEKNIFVNSCNDTSKLGPIVIDWKLNNPKKEEKHKIKRRSYEELKKNGYKYDYKNVRDHKKYDNSKEFQDNSRDDYSYEKEYNEEIIREKSKGEVKNDNWKKNKYENKQYYNQEEPKYNKYDKFEDNNKNDYNNKHRPSDDDLINSSENNKKENEYDRKYENHIREQNHENKFEHQKRDRGYDNKFEHNKQEHHDNKFEHNKREHDHDGNFEHNKRERDDQKFDHNKRERDYDQKFEPNKPKRDHDHKFENNKKTREFNEQFDYKSRDHDSDSKFEYNKKYDDNNRKFDYKKKDNDFNYKTENKRNNDYDNDSKFDKNLADEVDQFIKNSEDKPKYKNSKEYIIKPENFKESKYAKYQGNDRRDKKDKYQHSGDWQIQRGEAREKLRNSDWYFVRADSRQRMRTNEDYKDQEESEVKTKKVRSPPPTVNKKQRPEDESRSRTKDDFRKKVLRKVGRTWDFLNMKLRKFF